MFYCLSDSEFWSTKLKKNKPKGNSVEMSNLEDPHSTKIKPRIGVAAHHMSHINRKMSIGRSNILVSLDTTPSLQTIENETTEDYPGQSCVRPVMKLKKDKA
jgi:hypothetical protein